MDKIKGIYLIKVNDWGYVGQSTNIKVRIRSHKNHLVKNKHSNTILQNAFNKYKVFEYEILWQGECSNEELVLKEQYFIDNIPTKKKANIAKADLTKPQSKEHRKKISISNKNSKLVQASQKRAVETRQKEGEYLSKEKQSKNRKSISQLFEKRYFIYTKFVLYKKDKIIVATPFEFCMITGINKRALEQLLSHKTNYCYGWQLSAVAVVKESELLES